jgi:tRNA A-37 threonylcarbamoyl transferase component Bud32
MIGNTIGNLRIISEIGKGGMGTVYLAENVNLKKRFAVKSLHPALTQDPQFRERFYQEGLNQALLDHPNIVQVTDFIDENGQFLLVMQYVDGQSLSQVIKAKGKFEEREALSIFKEVLEGLNFAHRQGIINRDVKPSNILIDKDGRVRITDFGIAILVGTERLTATGTTVGTPWYMSPEQILHPRDIDHRSDVYSAGIVLYEMLTGDVPFDGETEFEIKNKQVNSPPPDPRQKNPGISLGLTRIILKALEKDPNNRYSGCAEFLQQIRDYEKPPISPPPPAYRWVLMAILLAITGTAVWWLVMPPRPTNVRMLPDDSGQHQSAFNLIQTTSDQFSIICIQFKEIELRRERLPIAKEHDTKIFEDLVKGIEENEQNIRDLLSRYNNNISELEKLKKTIVDEEFEKYTESLVQKKSFEKIQITRVVKLHYQQYLDDKKTVNGSILRTACLAPNR